ncbi:hypothetical protein HYDPIDRAFT_26203 [Hydnomerulius pinastri MD-312]|nr:hypothetical protein HYDPIDRAFT_26203 [Hydnomerulius pinastri MD-312]
MDGLSVHEQLYNLKHILHHNISPNNLIYQRAIPVNSAHRNLFVIDFDYAVLIDDGSYHALKGTGTLPFVSLYTMRQVTVNQEKIIQKTLLEEDAIVNFELADNLESFFYVFMWICVLHVGPNGAAQNMPLDNISFVVNTWGEGTM